MARIVPLAPFKNLASLAPFAFFVVAAVTQACGEPPVDDSRSERRLFPVKGVIQGAVSYEGPRPCSRNGHIVGSAVLLVFDRRNPPPPAGLANTAVNFGTVTGDRLFANEPRYTGNDKVYCPSDVGIKDTVAVSAPFVIAPMDEGSYIIQAFYDYTGDFLPTFKIRNLPELGDTGGGYVDVVDAAKNAGNPNYLGAYLPVDIGDPIPLLPTDPPDTIPRFKMPYEGFVRDNITITIANKFPFTRPYFYAENPSDPSGGNVPTGGPAIPLLKIPADFPDTSTKAGDPTKPHPGSQEQDPNYMPVITMTQDHHVFAPPKTKLPDNIDQYQRSFKQLNLRYGVPTFESDIAADVLDPRHPFHMQVKTPASGLFVWANTKPDGTPVQIPEGQGVPQIWPLIVFAKLQDDVDANGVVIPGSHTGNPQGLLAQGSKTDPVVIIQGLTLFNDSLVDTAGFGFGDRPDVKPTKPVDHVRVLVRPSAVCFNALQIDAGGVLVTPYIQGPTPIDTDGTQPIIDPASVRVALGKLVREFKPPACLPKGRYGINVVYPDGQAWTLPNEAGSCGGSEGSTDFDQLSCTIKPRPVLYSQGNRAILEIVDAADPAFCAEHAVPDECLPCSQRKNPTKFAECL